jgi:hypothetical protein
VRIVYKKLNPLIDLFVLQYLKIETAEGKENIQWTFLAKEQAGVLTKKIKPLYCYSVAVFLHLLKSEQ